MEPIEFKSFESSAYLKYAQNTIKNIKILQQSGIDTIKVADPEFLKQQLTDTINTLQKSKKIIAQLQKDNNNLMNDVEGVYDEITTSLNKLRNQLDLAIQNSNKTLSTEWFIGTLKVVVSAVQIGTIAWQIYEGDYGSAMTTGLGTVLTMTSNKSLQTAGYLISASGLAMSVFPSNILVEAINEMTNKQITSIAQTTASIAESTFDNVISKLRSLIDPQNSLVGNIFKWNSQNGPEIAGLIGPGDGSSEGFTLTNNTANLLNGMMTRGSAYQRLLRKLAIKQLQNYETPTSALSEWTPDVWDKVVDLHTTVWKNAEETAQESGLFGNALQTAYEQASKDGIWNSVVDNMSIVLTGGGIALGAVGTAAYIVVSGDVSPVVGAVQVGQELTPKVLDLLVEAYKYAPNLMQWALPQIQHLIV